MAARGRPQDRPQEASIERPLAEGAAPVRPLRVLQLTDTHLLADPAGSLLGQRTRSTFEAVLELAQNAFWPPDLILLTGDLVHDERPETYRYLAERMETQGIPYLGIPGNHDRPDLIAELLDPQGDRAARSVVLGGWHLILLDSTIAGHDGGRLSRTQLQGVDEALAREPGPALVCLHHHPVPVGCSWLDAIGLGNGDELLALLERYEQVRGVLWGHIHQSYSSRHGHRRLLGSPSTCVQFKPQSAEFALDDRPPGYRWLLLHGDGRIDTGIERLAEYPDPLSLDSDGY